MTSPQKRKGSAWEREIVAYLSANGFPAERIPAGATNDRGDLWIPIIEWPSIDAKNYANYSGHLSLWVDKAKQQAFNLGRRFGIVWFKRTNKTSAADGFVVMSGESFVTLMAMIGDK
jgi:hypothetical protein